MDTRTTNIEVFCVFEDGEIDVFAVASEHRSDLPKPFDESLQEWVTEQFGGLLKPGEFLGKTADMEYVHSR
jgi:hypothetical protein